MPRAFLLKVLSALSSYSFVLITFWARFAVLDQRLCMHRQVQAWAPAQAGASARLQASGPARVTLLGCHSKNLVSHMISSCGVLVPPLTCLNKHSTKQSCSTCWLGWGAGPVSGLGPFALVRPACAAPGASSTPHRPNVWACATREHAMARASPSLQAARIRRKHPQPAARHNQQHGVKAVGSRLEPVRAQFQKLGHLQ